MSYDRPEESHLSFRWPYKPFIEPLSIQLYEGGLEPEQVMCKMVWFSIGKCHKALYDMERLKLMTPCILKPLHRKISLISHRLSVKRKYLTNPCIRMHSFKPSLAAWIVWTVHVEGYHTVKPGDQSFPWAVYAHFCWMRLTQYIPLNQCYKTNNVNVTLLWLSRFLLCWKSRCDIYCPSKGCI